MVGMTSDVRLRGRTSLFLRWTWYIFSAAPQDLGLSSGGMVTPYSQPGGRKKNEKVHKYILYEAQSAQSAISVHICCVTQKCIQSTKLNSLPNLNYTKRFLFTFLSLLNAENQKKIEIIIKC